MINFVVCSSATLPGSKGRHGSVYLLTDGQALLDAAEGANAKLKRERRQAFPFACCLTGSSTNDSDEAPGGKGAAKASEAVLLRVVDFQRGDRLTVQMTRQVQTMTAMDRLLCAGRANCGGVAVGAVVGGGTFSWGAPWASAAVGMAARPMMATPPIRAARMGSD